MTMRSKNEKSPTEVLLAKDGFNKFVKPIVTAYADLANALFRASLLGNNTLERRASLKKYSSQVAEWRELLHKEISEYPLISTYCLETIDKACNVLSELNSELDASTSETETELYDRWHKIIEENFYENLKYLDVQLFLQLPNADKKQFKKDFEELSRLYFIYNPLVQSDRWSLLTKFYMFSTFFVRESWRLSRLSSIRDGARGIDRVCNHLIRLLDNLYNREILSLVEESPEEINKTLEIIEALQRQLIDINDTVQRIDQFQKPSNRNSKEELEQYHSNLLMEIPKLQRYFDVHAHAEAEEIKVRENLYYNLSSGCWEAPSAMQADVKASEDSDYDSEDEEEDKFLPMEDFCYLEEFAQLCKDTINIPLEYTGNGALNYRDTLEEVINKRTSLVEKGHNSDQNLNGLCDAIQDLNGLFDAIIDNYKNQIEELEKKCKDLSSNFSEYYIPGDPFNTSVSETLLKGWVEQVKIACSAAKDLLKDGKGNFIYNQIGINTYKDNTAAKVISGIEEQLNTAKKALMDALPQQAVSAAGSGHDTRVTGNQFSFLYGGEEQSLKAGPSSSKAGPSRN